MTSVCAWESDGNNAEVMWMLPRERWGEWATRTPDRTTRSRVASVVEVMTT